MWDACSTGYGPRLCLEGIQLGFEPAVDVVLLVTQDELNLLDTTYAYRL